MTDLAAEGGLLHAAAVPQPVQVGPFERWAYHNWPAIAAALRERDAWNAKCDEVGIPHDPDVLVRHHRANAGLTATMNARAEYTAQLAALRVRAETAEADADRLADEGLRHAAGCLIYGPAKECTCNYEPLLAAHAAAVEARPKPYVEEIMSDWAND